VNRPARRFPLTLERLPSRPGSAVAGKPAQPPAAQAVVQRPQRPLREAASDARLRHPPSGQGLDSDAVRARMVERLRAQGVDHEAVLRAIGAVPRHRFVDTALVAQAYEESSLPIGWEQTISKPVVVARMLALLAQAPGAARRPIRAPLGRALEIGTGCGYQAAVMARLCTRLTSIERLGPLLDKARETLRMLGLHELRLIHGDGRLGHAPHAPYDSIISAAGGRELPTAWIEQLAVGGRLVAPMEDGDGDGQRLLVVDKTEQGLQQAVHDAVHFVPLKSGHV
jgi:protein-L-isoaspartate(D-aspartate) O-methyltransferase